ncbi:lon protease homolog 1, mitochondrial-like isoform X2 [Rutidosis leptorrhynchoides]|uniref:lon protease homolog 1, mitochondrial-like isoform X2 n=1 Tax=Rutidosis leptorrhynchoides TaxID=125765 RepID=UPI003A98F6B6
MELLDPEKNGSFMDHYLSILINLYKMQVLLICTTNVLGTIPNPLRARIEIIHIYGYNLDENVCIARDYLEKRARVVSGIKVDQVYLVFNIRNKKYYIQYYSLFIIYLYKFYGKLVFLTEGAIRSLAENYCRKADRVTTSLTRA